MQLQRVDPPGPVIDAFRDVQRALADRARLRNEAESYRNDIVPSRARRRGADRAGGRGLSAANVARAQGDAARFMSVYNAFKASQDVTPQRLYLETMEEILKNSNKVIIDKSAQGGSGVLPYLPLPALGGGAKATAAPETPAAPRHRRLACATGSILAQASDDCSRLSRRAAGRIEMSGTGIRR